MFDKKCKPLETEAVGFEINSSSLAMRVFDANSRIFAQSDTTTFIEVHIWVMNSSLYIKFSDDIWSKSCSIRWAFEVDKHCFFFGGKISAPVNMWKTATGLRHSYYLCKTSLSSILVHSRLESKCAHFCNTFEMPKSGAVGTRQSRAKSNGWENDKGNFVFDLVYNCLFEICILW